MWFRPPGRLDPNAAAVPLDDLLANCQADSCARIFGLGMKPLKDHEDPLGVLLRNADAVIASGDLPVVSVSLGRYPDARWFLDHGT